MIRALVVEDDNGIRESLGDILASLRHRADFAACVEKARELLGQQVYDYVLLDLELPMRAKRGLPRIQNGENLLEEILAHPQQAGVSVIVMTGYGKDGPKLAVSLMKKGAVDFINKPFAATGDTLDKAIKEALEKRQAARAKAPREPSAPAAAAPPAPAKPPAIAAKPGVPPGRVQLDYYVDRVELNGVKVCGSVKSCMVRKILDLLKQRLPTGQYVAHSGGTLAKLVDSSGGQNAISQCVCRFRDDLKSLFPTSGALPISPRDVVISGGRGFRLNEKIVVVDHTAAPPAQGSKA